jgi:hypothetical protein
VGDESERAERERVMGGGRWTQRGEMAERKRENEGAGPEMKSSLRVLCHSE